MVRRAEVVFENGIGEVIRKQRRQNNLSQAELSEGICSRSHLSQIENGKRVPGPIVMARLTERLDLPLLNFVDEYMQKAAVSTGDYIRLARELTMREHFQLAKEILDIPKRFLQQQKKDPDSNYKFKRDYKDALAYWYNRQGEYNNALHHYHDYLRLCQRRPSNRYHLARAHFVVGNNTIYVDGYTASKEPLLLAFGHIISLAPDSSRIDFQRVISLHEKVMRSLLHVLVRLKEHQVARDIYEMARMRWDELGILENPNENILLDAGLSFLGAGDIENARQLFETIAFRTSESPLNRLCLANLGLIYRVKGQIYRALGFLEEAWELYQEDGGWDGRAVVNEITLCHIDLGNHKKAEEWIELAEGIEHEYPFEPNPDTVGQTLVAKANLLRQKEEDDAFGCLQQAENLNLSEEGRWGLSFEKLHYLIQQGHSTGDITDELDRLKNSLPGIFTL